VKKSFGSYKRKLTDSREDKDRMVQGRGTGTKNIKGNMKKSNGGGCGQVNGNTTGKSVLRGRKALLCQKRREGKRKTPRTAMKGKGKSNRKGRT